VNQVIEQLTSHRSIRRYSERVVDDDMLHSLIRAGQGAPSSSFIQAYSIIRVRETLVRDAISTAAGDQRWIRAAPVFLVMCADLRRIARAVEKTGGKPLAGHTEHFLAASVDGAVFIGGIRNDPMTVSELLELPGLVYPVFGMCLGWPDQDPEVKPRLPVEMILHEDRYHDERIADDVDRYDEMMRAYYATRSENQRGSDWSTPTAAAIQGKTRPHMLDFLRGRGFLKR
jgi:nitroreductase